MGTCADVATVQVDYFANDTAGDCSSTPYSSMVIATNGTDLIDGCRDIYGNLWTDYTCKAKLPHARHSLTFQAVEILPAGIEFMSMLLCLPRRQSASRTELAPDRSHAYAERLRVPFLKTMTHKRH